MRLMLVAALAAAAVSVPAAVLSDAELLDRLVRIPSVTENVAEVNRATAFVKEYLEDGGVLCKVERTGEGRDVLWASTKPGNVQDFVICVHVDVVAGPPKMFEPVIRDGIMYGRGTTDCKANVVMAAQVLRKLVGKASVGVIFSSDEESGRNDSTTAFLIEKGYTARKMVLVADAGHGTIITAQKGSAKIKLTAKGKAGHSSAPWSADNALEKLMSAWPRVKTAWEAEGQPATSEYTWRDSLAATFIAGGKGLNVIPSSAELFVNLRYVKNGGCERFMALVARVASELQVECVSDLPPVEDSGPQPLIEGLRKAMRAKWPGSQVPDEHCNACTDAHHFSKLGVPVAVTGVSFAGPHSDDECVRIRDIGEFADMFSEFVKTQTTPHGQGSTASPMGR